MSEKRIENPECIAFGIFFVRAMYLSRKIIFDNIIEGNSGCRQECCFRIFMGTDSFLLFLLCLFRKKNNSNVSACCLGFNGFL